MDTITSLLLLASLITVVSVKLKGYWQVYSSVFCLTLITCVVAMRPTFLSGILITTAIAATVLTITVNRKNKYRV